MRITVNLSIFFHDHRSLAKIFVNKKMKCIKDVEDHITNIFKIKNFYLKCDNQYLPPTESVEILNYDDIVWAVPVENYSANINQNGNKIEKQKTKKKRPAANVNEIVICEKKNKKHKEHINHDNDRLSDYQEPKQVIQNSEDFAEVADADEVITYKKKNKKQKEHLDHSIEKLNNYEEPKQLQVLENGENFMDVEDIPPKPKKKKSKKSHVGMDASFASNENSECEGNNSVCDTVSKKQKMKNSSVEDTNIKKPSPKDSGRDSLESTKKEESSPEDSNKVKSLISTFEKKKINFAKHFRQAIENESERRVNIVKTIIISNSTKPEEPKLELPNAEDQELSNEQKEEHSDAKNPENMNTPNDADCSNLETSNSISCTTLNELDVNVNKRKRKRTRTHKRKHASNGRQELNTTFEQPVYNIIHKPFIVQTPTHIRFREQSTPKRNEVPVTNELVINSEQKDSSKTDVIIISESPVAPIKTPGKPEESVVETDVANVETTYSDKDIEACILKQPITANAEPRIGDVIAFKILRISENYTPEVSSTVVGKVINYNQEDKEIIFNIVYGREQCLMPQGKFSLETDTDENPTPENSQFQCCWSSLLEPRLLFP